MTIKLVPTLLALTVLLFATCRMSEGCIKPGGICRCCDSYTMAEYKNQHPDEFREAFEEAKNRCDAALSGSCDLGILNGLAGQLDSFGNDPTSSEETEIVANNGGLSFFCKKSVPMVQCVLEVIDGDQCEAYRHYSRLDDAIDDIRGGVNQLIEKCPRDIKSMHHMVKKFLKHRSSKSIEVQNPESRSSSLLLNLV